VGGACVGGGGLGGEMNQALYAHMNNKRKMKKNNNKIKYPTNKGENYEKKKKVNMAGFLNSFKSVQRLFLQ
jgi:hypothetical protein